MLPPKSMDLHLTSAYTLGPSSIKRSLLRFRFHKFAIAADIEKAFLMIEKDCDVLRFLWVDDVSKTNPETIVLRFTRVVFGVSSTPFLLNATIRHHLEKHSAIRQ